MDPRKFGYDFSERLSNRLSVCPQSMAGERGDFKRAEKQNQFSEKQWCLTANF